MPSASALCRSDIGLVESAETLLNSPLRINLKAAVTPAVLVSRGPGGIFLPWMEK